ncbi:MAG: hypothetical protein CL537_08325 [Alcanivoracaceae bacterium]|uniref:porin family protein n=1 Tax=Alcanivorax profundi TaxID=2338368 RepID=UPI000C40BC19|nr:hypothetical protein [Alcanivoracaceae bacterium]|tara:strand:- start:548 stop:1060 length:513 start_codon:yes stop_codon:yes gene_type:complete
MKRLQQLIAGVALCSLAPLSTAGVYIGAGLYNTAVDEEVENVKFDDDNTTGGLFLGWRPIELVGVEVGYYDFGEIEGEFNTEVEGGALTFAGLLSVELGPVGLYGKGGIANTDFDIKHPLGDDDDSSTDAFGGLGATVDLMDKLYVYAEYMRFDNELNVDMFGAGLRFQF